MTAYLHTICLDTLHHEKFEKMQIYIATLFVCLAVEAQAELAKESGWGPVLVGWCVIDNPRSAGMLLVG